MNANFILPYIPEGREIPARFEDFLRAKPPFRIEWDDLDAYDLKASATKEAVPFLRLPDGGLVAFWYHAATPAIVHIGGHGELEVLALDFHNFLKGIGKKCSGLPDFDEGRLFCVPGVEGEPKREGLVALQQQFDEWFEKHTSLLNPMQSPETEALRQRVHQIAEDMIRDGCSKVYTLASPWWAVDFQIERTGKNLSITYLDYGKWWPLAEKYKLVEEVTALLNLVKNKARSRYELSTSSSGIVSIDRDRELVLVPPDAEAK